jgi:valyl-tRNA synthetase
VAVVAGGTAALELAGLKDPAAEQAKLARELEKLEKELAALRGRLDNPRYLEKAPADEVEKATALAAEKAARLDQVRALLG